MTEFTPVSALIGGALIGLSVVFFMATMGRIAGISGIVSGLMAPKGSDFGWKLAFVAGLMAAPFVYAMVRPEDVSVAFPHSIGFIVAGGLLVGIGSRLGSGCTSGHGICGMARLSPRSIVATLTFMATGIITVFVIRMIGGAA
ncbi:YeeE/YedE family protein [Gimibacter soli]|uniref:YeeE/YedE family protein n=1 Tax=Gimibacter soli TaxID=3024400 RepID=A0AAE9XSD8_9PROT|nr:YeeE/YedE family protein [Gimibacter soli]WCL55339.1 YeeE/YedE family protein [Gimibacter soli]